MYYKMSSYYILKSHQFGTSSEDEVYRLLDGMKAYYSGQAPHRYLRVDLVENLDLARYLKNHNFFDFLVTNGGRFVYVHQIIAYFYCGGIEACQIHGLTAPKGTYECHHLDGNTLNNHHMNLVWLSSQDHHIVTKHQRGIFKRIRLFKYKHELKTKFNRRGRLIKNWEDWFPNILGITLLKTNQWFHKCSGYLKGICNWISKVTARLNYNLDTTYLPNPLFIRIDKD